MERAWNWSYESTVFCAEFSRLVFILLPAIWLSFMKTFSVKTDESKPSNFGERILKLLRYCNATFLRSDEAFQTKWNSEIFNMIFSNVLQKSSENESTKSALAAIEVMKKKFHADPTFLVDFYAKFQLRKVFSHYCRTVSLAHWKFTLLWKPT